MLRWKKKERRAGDIANSARVGGRVPRSGLEKRGIVGVLQAGLNCRQTGKTLVNTGTKNGIGGHAGRDSPKIGLNWLGGDKTFGRKTFPRRSSSQPPETC